jgi:predicted transcriptional regulator
MSTMTLHLSESTSAKLDEEALVLASIEAGIADADAGRFVSDAVVEGFFARFADGTPEKWVA